MTRPDLAPYSAVVALLMVARCWPADRTGTDGPNRSCQSNAMGQS
jgi:hypothetical protein